MDFDKRTELHNARVMRIEKRLDPMSLAQLESQLKYVDYELEWLAGVFLEDDERDMQWWLSIEQGLIVELIRGLA